MTDLRDAPAGSSGRYNALDRPTASSPSPFSSPTTPTTSPTKPPRSPQPHLHRSAEPSSPSSSIPSTLSEQEDYIIQPYAPTPVPGQPPAARQPGVIFLARRGSTSSGRYLQLGSVPNLAAGARAGTPVSASWSEETGRDAAGQGEGGGRPRSRLGMVEEARDQATYSQYQPSPRSPVGPPPDLPAPRSEAHASSYSSNLAVGRGGISPLSFPSPPARTPSGSRLSPPLRRSPASLTPPLPSSPSNLAESLPLAGRRHHPNFPSQSSVTTPLSRPQPYSPTSEGYSNTSDPHTSGSAALSAEHGHTFGHGTSSLPTRPFPSTQPNPNRLSAYDPLAGEVSDMGSYGSSPTLPSGRSPAASPVAAAFEENPGRAISFGRPALTIRSKSTKSSKSSRSARSAKSGKARAGSSKRASGSSLAYRLADLSWTLRPGTPEEIGEEEGLLEGGMDAGGEGGQARGKKRKKSLRSIRREEQDLDLGRLLGRAAVLEKILNAGKRVSNQSLRYRSMRATDSPLPYPLPDVLPHHLYPQPRRRPFSLISAKTADSSAGRASSSTHHVSGNPIPPLPPLPTHARPRAGQRHSLSISSSVSVGRRRFTLGKRVQREGEWGGEGYTSLPASAAGSVAREHGEGVDEYPEEKEGGVLLFPVEASPPTPPKPPQPTYCGLGNAGRQVKEDEGIPGCLSGCTHGPAEIMLPPSCIPTGTRHIFHKSYRPATRPRPDIDRQLPPRSPYAAQDEKLVHRSFGSRTVEQQQGAARRRSRVLSYVSTGQASWKSRRRWIIWIGVGCAVGLGVASAVLGGVLGARP